MAMDVMSFLPMLLMGGNLFGGTSSTGTTNNGGMGDLMSMLPLFLMFMQ